MEEFIKIISETGTIGIAGALIYIVWQVSNRINETNVNHLTHLQSSVDLMVNEMRELRNDIRELINKK